MFLQQVWSMEKLEHKLIVMREMYDEQQNDPLAPQQEADPFYESQENHNLIGVANIFLDCLFHDVRLNYHVPIISQQGEVAGRLQVRIWFSSVKLLTLWMKSKFLYIFVNHWEKSYQFQYFQSWWYIFSGWNLSHRWSISTRKICRHFIRVFWWLRTQSRWWWHSEHHRHYQGKSDIHLYSKEKI